MLFDNVKTDELYELVNVPISIISIKINFTSYGYV